MEIKDVLKKRRHELNLTLLDVAKAVGVSEATVSRWESGHIENMRRDKIAQLSKILQISPAVIMGWEEDSSQSSEEEWLHQIETNPIPYSVLIGQGSENGQQIRKLTRDEYDKIIQFLDIIEKK